MDVNPGEGENYFLGDVNPSTVTCKNFRMDEFGTDANMTLVAALSRILNSWIVLTASKVLKSLAGAYVFVIFTGFQLYFSLVATWRSSLI